MKISLIVPCFNQANYLYGLLQNVTNATNKLHEVIIINDGSTDPRVREMIDLLQPMAEHQKIVKIHQENVGLAATRNVGLNRAVGEYIQFLDSDDTLVPGKMDRQIYRMEKEKIDVLIDDYMIADEHMCVFTTPHAPLSTQELSFNNIALMWERGVSIPIHCPLIRAKSLGSVRFPDGMRAKEDWVFWMLLLRKTRKAAYSDNIGAIYRVHSNSMTRNDLTGMAYEWLKALDKAIHLLGPDFDDEKKEETIKHFNNFYTKYFYKKDNSFNKNLFQNYLKTLIN